MLHDSDIREPLFEFLEGSFGKIRIFEEKQIGKTRADIVMVTETAVCGIEIKSDADTYTRLSRQVHDYDRFYDMNFVVVGSSHAVHIEEHVPEWWGIITVEENENPELEGTLDFYVLRKPKPNPELDWKKKISILWRPEMAHIQELNHMHKYDYLSKAAVAEKILATVPEDVLSKQLCDELFERDYEKIAETINEYRVAHGQKKRRKRRKKYRRVKKSD